MVNLEYSYFQRKVLDLTGIDLSSYKSEQMRRRLGTIMARSGAHNLFEYYRLLSRDKARLQEFRDFVTINVSEFFRIPDKFDYLRTHVLPGLMADRRKLRVWSAGCSNGSEPYSLAIVLTELAPFGQWQILATDIDATVLERARAGIYQPADLVNVKSGLLKQFFVATGNQFQAADRIRNRVQFKTHDLLRDEYEKDFDLIVCRHVVIYFTEPAKEEIFRKFNDSLRPGGVLFIGGTEVMKNPSELGYSSISVSFYRKVGAPPPSN
ncbi:MAG: protein-glutamate O-methyltransferase CheR [Chloroflexi bacterium]|nr:protein-glutamate O-methyltransferase CheR [Chloroflexota bacterium]